MKKSLGRSERKMIKGPSYPRSSWKQNWLGILSFPVVDHLPFIPLRDAFSDVNGNFRLVWLTVAYLSDLIALLEIFFPWRRTVHFSFGLFGRNHTVLSVNLLSLIPRSRFLPIIGWESSIRIARVERMTKAISLSFADVRADLPDADVDPLARRATLLSPTPSLGLRNIFPFANISLSAAINAFSLSASVKNDSRHRLLRLIDVPLPFQRLDELFVLFHFLIGRLSTMISPHISGIPWRRATKPTNRWELFSDRKCQRQSTNSNVPGSFGRSIEKWKAKRSKWLDDLRPQRQVLSEESVPNSDRSVKLSKGFTDESPSSNRSRS